MTSTFPERLSGHGFRNAGEVVAMRQSLSRRYVPHWHDFHEIGLVTSGRGTHRIDGKSGALVPGDVFIVSPSSLHAIAPAADHVLGLVDVTFDALVLPPEVALPLSALTATGEPVVVHLDGTSASFALFEGLLTESETVRPYRQIAARALLVQLIVALARDLRFAPGGGTAPPWLARVLAHIEQHFARPISQDELAAVANLSPCYLREQFRQETGSTLTRHLQQVRLRAARSLLATTDLTVSQVRRASGFGDASHFARAFRATAGCSPTDYRRASR